MSFVPTRVPAPPRRPGTVAVTVDGVCRRGRAVDLRGQGLSASTLVDAVRVAATHGPTPMPRPSVHVDCDPAAPAHAFVARIPPRSFDLYDALAVTARSRGVVAPSTPALERARDALVAHDADVGTVDRSAAKRRVASAGARERRLDERVATLRGRLDALREVDADSAAVETVEAELSAAVGELTEVETERIAAEQRLQQVERVARSSRDRRQRRLRLADRVDNLRRRVRGELVAAVYPAFAATVEALPGDAAAGDRPADFTGERTTAALAVARLAPLDAPVVLSTERFGSPAEAATRLDVPVVQL